MSGEDVVKMSPKGQLVVPKEIREEAGFEPSDRFIAVSVEDGVMFKKIDFDVQEEYDRLSEKVQKRFNEQDISEDEVEDAVEWARG
ncbi:AbrB/MazE/SpoVT family DNA-binding domain-containing protein [Halobellus rubicundus]|uniref:AbrB/MazE/SpoVT family DNA-binding domain-containing protein n=1 Tax=Halobellus rubicundus TaxID=2996466 RepID=A0ABD5M9C4_9EURY